jgi:ubiquitin-conjugating enzyme E2 variant
MSAFLRNTTSLGLDVELKTSTPSTRKAEQSQTCVADSASDADTTAARPQPPAGCSGIEDHSTPFHAFLEYSMSFAFPILFVPNIYLSVNRLYELELLWLALLAIPLGLLWGDLVTGLVHWAADTYCSEDTPVIGQSLIKPFRLHHTYPRDICTHNLITTVGNTCILAVPLLSLCLYLMWADSESGWLAFTILCVSLMAGATVATNQFHKWAHQEKPSRMVRLLQRLRLVLEPTHHESHHTEPFNVHYCITNGWLNPLLNKIKFFRRLEAALAFFGFKTAKAQEQHQPQMDTD